MPDFTIHIQWLSFIHQLRGAEPSPQLKYAQNTLETSIKEIGPFFIASVLIKQYRAMMISCTKPTALLLYVCFWTAWNRDLKTIRWEWAIIILSCTWLPSGGQHIKLIFFCWLWMFSPTYCAQCSNKKKKPITNVFCFSALVFIEFLRIAGGHHPLFKIALSSIFFQPCPRTVSNYLAHLYADFNRKKIYEYATCQFCNDFLSNANLLKSGFRSHHIVEFYFFGEKKHDNFL